ncbi:unnamed protein product [Anisakis simplex]|uniref:CHK domain-containing protein n=1 Tax=Anisakis simplex TaxID=6269 RepID=A0A0M3JRT0_ANISI|nr:unnamed protein product [Anisakis simplex]
MSAITREEPNKNENPQANDQSILGTNVTWSYLQQLLTTALGTTAEFGANKRIEPIGVGQGFMSSMGRIYPDWTSHKETLPETVVVKIPSVASAKKYIESTNLAGALEKAGFEREGEKQYSDYERMMKTIHNVEVAFYRKNEALSDTRFKVPKAYAVESFEEGVTNGILILEDLRTSQVVPIYEKVSVEEAEQVIDELVRIHAASIADESWLELNSLTIRELLKMTDTDGQKFVQMILMTAELDTNRLGPKFEKLRDICSDALDMKSAENVHKEMGLKPILVHGDMWSSNVMYTKERQKDGCRKLTAIVDWQTIHQGCAAEDLARYICSALDGADRRKHCRSLLNRYYTELNGLLAGKVPFTYEQLLESFDRLLPFHLTFLLPTLGPLLLNGIKQALPDQYEEVRRRMIDKAEAIVDDALYYYELNKKTYATKSAN